MQTSLTQTKSGVSKKYLVFGLLLFSCGAIANYIYFNSHDPTKNGELNGPFVEQVKNFPPLLLIAFPLIFAPIIEEFAFRGWLMSTVTRKIISVVLVVFYVQSAFQSLLLSVIVFLLLILFLFKVGKYFFAVNVIFTSLLFSSVHIQNFNDPFITFAALTQLFGVGLILSFITCRFGIVYAIILHAINNTIAFLPFILVSNSDQELVFEGETYSATLTPVSIFNVGESNTYDYTDSISITNNLTEIAVALAPFETDMIYTSPSINLAHFKLKVYPTLNLAIDPTLLFMDYLRVNKISSDTLQKAAFTLERVSNFQYQPGEEPTYKTSLFSLVQQIRNKYDIPLWIPTDLNDSIYTIDISTISMSNFDDFRNYLERKQGLRIHDPNQIELKEVCFKRQKN